MPTISVPKERLWRELELPADFCNDFFCLLFSCFSSFVSLLRKRQKKNRTDALEHSARGLWEALLRVWHRAWRSGMLSFVAALFHLAEYRFVWDVFFGFLCCVCDFVVEKSLALCFVAASLPSCHAAHSPSFVYFVHSFEKTTLIDFLLPLLLF